MLKKLGGQIKTFPKILKKLSGRVKTLITKSFRKRSKPYKPPIPPDLLLSPPTESPPPPSSPSEILSKQSKASVKLRRRVKTFPKILKKLSRRVKTLVTKSFRIRSKPYKPPIPPVLVSSPPTVSPPPPTPPSKILPKQSKAFAKLRRQVKTFPKILKKLGRRIKTLVTKSLRKRSKPYKPPIPPDLVSSPPTVSPPPPSPLPEILPKQSKASAFLFPRTESTVLPDPSPFFSPSLLSSPLPTNSFFQNFVLNHGDQPEYIHPYLIKLENSTVSLCYPSMFFNAAFLYQIFNPDLSISAPNDQSPNQNSTHLITSFDDLSLTVDFPSSYLRFYLVRGSPFLTCSVLNKTEVSISTIHAILSVNPNHFRSKYTIKLNNNQTWLLYGSAAMNLTHSDISSIKFAAFSGVFRLAVLPESDSQLDPILDQFSSCYPVSGTAVFSRPFCLEYKWEKKGWGDLLMLANPLHLQLLSGNDCDVTVLGDFKYKSIDGDLVSVVGDSWILRPDPISVTWHSIKGVSEESYAEIVSALYNDVQALDSKALSTTSSYFYGKLIARAARLALIAEEVSYHEVIPKIRIFLKESIEPWLNGTFSGNAFLYDEKWGGLVTKQGSKDSDADFGFGVYNDHHNHLGYFVYAIAVHAKIDPAWGRKYRPQAYSLMADYMNLGKRSDSDYTRLRCFDLWKLHSWAGGLTVFADGRNQESTSEAVNAYYSAALMGLAYGDAHLASIGSTITAFEIASAQMWWHVREGDTMYGEDFTRENRIVGVLWANKRDSGLWFAPHDWKECRLGIQLLPLLPITEVLFSNISFARELVKWALPALGRHWVGEGWKGFVYALEAVYDKKSALEKVRKLSSHDDGNSLTNLLWWILSRGDEEGYEGIARLSFFSQHCH